MSQDNKLKNGKIYIILLFALGAVFIVIGTVLGGNKISTDNKEERVKNMECDCRRARMPECKFVVRLKSIML